MDGCYFHFASQPPRNNPISSPGHYTFHLLRPTLLMLFDVQEKKDVRSNREKFFPLHFIPFKQGMKRILVLRPLIDIESIERTCSTFSCVISLDLYFA